MIPKALLALETLWWLFVAALILGGIYSAIHRALWRRRRRRPGQIIRERWLVHLAAVREREIAELRQQDRARRAEIVSDNKG